MVYVDISLFLFRNIDFDTLFWGFFSFFFLFLQSCLIPSFQKHLNFLGAALEYTVVEATPCLVWETETITTGRQWQNISISSTWCRLSCD